MADFYLDHCVSLAVAPTLRLMGHRATTARDQNRTTDSDDRHLLFAAENHWIVVSHNGDDFILLHQAWRRWSEAWGIQPMHSGILIVPPLDEQAIAWQLNEIAQFGYPLRNELYEWDPNTRWVRCLV